MPESSDRAISRSLSAPAVGMLFLLATISATWQLVSFPGQGFGRGFETPAVARSVVNREGFANPFAPLKTGPTAHLAPFYPLLLAGLIRVFGDAPAAGVVAAALCILMHALHAVLMIPLSRLLLHDDRAGAIAALYLTVVPTIRVLPQWEAIYSAAALIAFCLASARLLRSHINATAKGAATGAFCGFVLLINPALLTVCGLWIAYLLWERRLPLRGALAVCASFALAGALVCLPWTLRNYNRLGAFFFIRDNLGLELYSSNADCSDGRDAVNRRNGCHDQLQANQNEHEARLVRELGEVSYNRVRMADAKRWIAAHPARFAALTAQRFREYWFPSPEPPAVYEYSLCVLTVLSAAGLFLMIRERNSAVWFILAASTLYPAVYYLVQTSSRFRFPVVWLSLLPAALAIDRITRRFRIM